MDYFDMSDEGWGESRVPHHMFPAGVCLSHAVMSLDSGQPEKGKTLTIRVEPYPSSHNSKESLVRKLYYAVLIRPSLWAPFCLRAV